MKHSFTITSPPEKIPSKAMPDGAITGNGDLSVVWSGTTDRIRLYIGKNDFWKANPVPESGGGHVPLGMIEILIPHLPYSDYRVEEDLDNAKLTGYFSDRIMNAKLTVIVCATENTVMIEMDRTAPGLSVSVGLLPLEGNGAACEHKYIGNLECTTRSFIGEELYFNTESICVLKEVSTKRENGREITRWTVHVATNHDSAAYRENAVNAAISMDLERYDRLLDFHSGWWKRFWSVSGLEIEDKELENHWYMGLYTMACCARNKKFPPGLWGNFSTSDGMNWMGDFHLNYNFQAPFMPLFCANHVELTDCYHAPLFDFLPRARQYARQYLGCRGVYYPVAIGPIGMESDLRAETKEHGHLFLGQKSHAAYCAMVMAMRWYSTYDEDYARDYALPFMMEVADFWEDYLVKRDGKYYFYNDALFEVAWWRGADYMPTGYDEINSLASLGFVRMFMKCLVDICHTLGVFSDRIEKWQDIVDCLPHARISEINENTVINEYIPGLAQKIRKIEPNGKKVICPSENNGVIESYVLEYIFPAGGASPIHEPEMFEAAKNTFELLDCWEDERMPYSICPSAARLGCDPEKIIERLKAYIKGRQLRNGALAFIGGGIENTSIIPTTLQEMMLQSYENVIKLFPAWNRNSSASFRGWRTYGAFIVDASVENGKIEATIRSEKGKTLSIYAPGDGYALYIGDRCIPLTEKVTTVDTAIGDVFKLVLQNS